MLKKPIALSMLCQLESVRNTIAASEMKSQIHYLFVEQLLLNGSMQCKL
jgi:ferric iron reductase protein FhuF